MMVPAAVLALCVTGAAGGAVRAAQGGADASRDTYLQRLIEALERDDSYKVRLQATVLLGKSKDPRAVEPLLTALNVDAHPTVRAAAATALGTMREPRAIAPLVTRIATDTEAFVRQEAATALAQFPREQALPYVLVAYGSEDPAVRRQVLVYGGTEPSASLDGVLMRALGDTPEVYGLASAAIAKMPAEDGLRILTGAVSHRDPAVRRGAVHVLRDMGTPEAATLIREVYERDIEVDDVREATCAALRQLRRFLPLGPLLEDAGATDKHVRAHALKLLGVLGGTEAQTALTRALGAEDAYIRGTAVLALRDFGDPGIIPQLERMAEDPSNRRILPLVRHTLKQLRTQRDNTEASVCP